MVTKVMKEDTELREVPLSSEELYQGRIVHLFCDKVRLPNGKEATREVIRHVGAVCVVPLTSEGEVICVRQYRYPTGQVLLEIPAGKLDSPQEDREEAIRRELREETGCRCGKLTRLGDLYTTPAYVDERITLYLAEDLQPGEQDLDEDEFLHVVRIPLEELCDRILAGEVTDAKTQAAVLRVCLMKQREAASARKGEGRTLC